MVGAFYARHGQSCACSGPFLPQIYLSKVHTQIFRFSKNGCSGKTGARSVFKLPRCATLLTMLLISMGESIGAEDRLAFERIADGALLKSRCHRCRTLHAAGREFRRVAHFVVGFRERLLSAFRGERGEDF